MVANFTSEAGQALTLRFIDRAMMQVSDNSATSMLVKDPTFGLARDSLDLNEWLASQSGISQGWGVLTAINDLDAFIAWQGQHNNDTRDQISLLRSPRSGMESVRRRTYHACLDGGGNQTGRCRLGTGGNPPVVPCPNPGDTCTRVLDPWGDLGVFLAAEAAPGRTTFCPTPLSITNCTGVGIPNQMPGDYDRYSNMGLNTATPLALGMLQEKLANGIYDPGNGFMDPNTTLQALTVMSEFTGLRNGSSPTSYTPVGTVTLPSHISAALTHTKGGVKGDSCSDAAIYRIGPDAVVLNVLNEDNGRGCGGSLGVRDVLFFTPPGGLPTMAAPILQQLTADLVTCALEDANFGPAQTWEGRTFDVSCEISNDGGIDSPAFDVTFVASGDPNINLNDGIIGTVRVQGIQAGSSAPANFVGSFPDGVAVPGGSYNLGWVIDADRTQWNIGEVGEWDESPGSNTGLIPGNTLEVVAPPPPPCPDADSDGYADCEPGYLCDPDNVTCGDCDDGNGARYPGAIEVCDQQDNDCNAVVDDGASRAWAAEVLLEPDPDSSDGLGHSIARIGDVDGDQVSDFVVGVFKDDLIAGSAGSVYLYSGATRERICIATDPGGVSSDQLGFSVAGVGDVTGPSGGARDGIPDFVAGVPLDDDMGSSSGSVVVFSGSDCSFARKLVDPNGATNDRLGESVIGLWTTDTGDHVPDIAAGAPGSDLVASNAGKVVVFSGTASGSVAAELFDAAQGESNDALGTSLAAFGEHTGGVDDTLIAGAPGADPSGTTDSGRLVLFDGTGGTLLDRYSGPILENGQRMGDSVITLPDFTGDGVPEMATGATSGDTGAGANRGRVYILDGADGALITTLIDPSGGGSGDNFGNSLGWLQRVAGVLGDEVGIVVGAADKDTAGTRCRRVLRLRCRIRHLDGILRRSGRCGK